MAIMATDHRKQPRRRGEALNNAIFQAVLDELADVGYAGLTMEGVAGRAGTGKASVYRRWPTRIHLVTAAVYSRFPACGDVPDTGNLRDDLLEALRRVAAAMEGTPGLALRAVLSEVLTDPTKAALLRQDFPSAARRMMIEVARRAVERGEIAEVSVTPRRMATGAALMRHYVLFHHQPVTEELIVQIVDEVMVPLLSAPVP
ncbi:TetR/AcrR family transcriptional regulator [Nonomuraea longicatena]|uniref:TetR/AcrR family transcriptional regulator n=1 Tax=Nonomuraea longicatena TaxID=83682 RepID=A0ABP3ZZR1_9ACTN